MSEYGETRRGGCRGIITSHEEMHDLAVKLGAKYADEYVPLPEQSFMEQERSIGVCMDHYESVTYWEKTDGSHGWACRGCGTVIQWG